MLVAVEVHSKVPFVPKLDLPLIGNDGLGPFHIRKVEGLDPVKSVVNSKGYGALDGEYYTGSHVGKRNIVMTLGMNPSANYQSVSELRKLLYAYLMPKMNPILKFVTNDRPLVQIEGYVESLEGDRFVKDPDIQVSVICPKPFFESSEGKTVGGAASNNPIDQTFIYEGDMTNGVIFQLFKGSSAYTGPITIEIGRVGPVYRKFETVATVEAGRFFQVDSRQGIKKVESRSLPANLRVANLLGTITSDSLWPYLVLGTNKIRVRTNSGVQLPWILYFAERYGGL